MNTRIFAPSMNHSLRNTRQEFEPRIDLSIVIVNYNVCEFLTQALLSIEAARSDLSIEVWVVDNNSIDGSVAAVRDNFPHVHLIANKSNVGFGAANNQALAEAKGTFALILNPDTILQEDTLTEMVSFMREHPGCGALGCQILNPDGSFAPESRRTFPTPEIAFYRMTGLGRLFPKSKRFGRYNLTYLPHDQATEVDALSGSCMMVRQEALFGAGGAGIFDEDFFMYGEDLDLCFRIKEAGWKIWFTPSTQIIHYKGESTKKGESKYVRLFYGAMLLFIEKHLESQHSTFFASVLRIGIMIRAGLSLTANASKRLTPLFLDFAGVYVSVILLGYFRYAQSGASISTLFFATTAPAYSLATVIAIATSGGYKRGGRAPSTPVFSGLLVGFLFVASMSYFVQEIAFSRLVVVASFPLSLFFLLGWRYLTGRRGKGPRKAVLVGTGAEALRLTRLLVSHPRPPFDMEGFVTDVENEDSGEVLTAHPGRIPRLGRLTNLRDLVRIRGFDDIVFAARDVSNQTIFRTMRELRDLSVQFRMLHGGSDHVIGKSHVSQLSVRSFSVDVTEIVSLRSFVSIFLFEKALSILFFPLVPLLWIASSMRRNNSGLRRGIPRLGDLWDVLRGEKGLIGYRPNDADLIPENWNLKPGVFSATNTMASSELESGEILRAYWYYVTHQTPGLDLEIIRASFRAPTTGTGR